MIASANTQNTNPDHPLFILSNEKFVAEPLSSDGDFTLVGCSWLRLVGIAQSLIKKDSLSKPDKLKIPQLIVADSSSHVIKAWNRLKSLFKRAENLSDFLKKFSEENVEAFFKDIIVYTYDSSNKPNVMKLRKEVVLCISEITQKGALFSWMKEMVLKAQVFQLDWTEKNSFECLKEHLPANKPVHVYASNIPEYVYYSLSSYNEAFLEPLLNVHNNTCTINPKSTVYAVTSWQRLIESQGCSLRPEVRVIVEGSHADYHNHCLVNASKNGIHYTSEGLTHDILPMKDLSAALPIVNQFEKEKSRATEAKNHQRPKAKKENYLGLKKGFIN